MPNELNPKDLRNLWQSQERENVTITLEEIRLRAARFERRIWWRNFQAAGVLLIAWFLAALHFSRGLDLLGPVLLTAGVVYITGFNCGGGARSARFPPMRIPEALSGSTGWNWSGDATLCGPSGAGTCHLSSQGWRLSLRWLPSNAESMRADRLYHSGGAGFCRSLGSEPVGSAKTQPQNPAIAQDGGR